MVDFLCIITEKQISEHVYLTKMDRGNILNTKVNMFTYFKKTT